MPVETVWTNKHSFSAVDNLVKKWELGEYVHHVQLLRDRAEQGTDYLVVFSLPKPVKPVPEYVAQATFTVAAPRDGSEPPKIYYCVETHKQRLPGRIPIRKSWLNAAIRQKQMVAKASAVFKNTGKLAPPAAFVPGQYKLNLGMQAEEGIDDAEERLMDAMAGMAEAQDIAARNQMESVEELEKMLVAVFNDGDKDGNGYLDPQEFFQLLESSQLGLDDSDKRQLLCIADANGDGKIEYAEFAPLGADIIQTMRVRRLNEQEQEVAEHEAELHARAYVHGMGMENVTQALLEQFREFDKDGSGRLERGEIVEALNDLTLGSTKLTPREIRMVMTYIDDDNSGTVEYNEFAPLMFNYLIEAFKLGFMKEEQSDLAAYLTDHLTYYDTDNDGLLPRSALKIALAEADLIGLTPIQVHSLLADALTDAVTNSIEIAAFVNPAAGLITKMCDPQLEYKRKAVSQMAKVTPLGALTPDEKARLATLAMNVFKNYDKDGSGRLDRVEFFSCLREAQLGFNDGQINALMFAADEDEDGSIDYREFSELFDNCILEMARLEKIDKMIEGEAAAATATSDLQLLLDELMIPLRIAFDILSEGGEASSSASVVQMLLVKCPEWGVGQEAMDILSEAVIARGESLAWPHFVEEIEKCALC